MEIGKIRRVVPSYSFYSVFTWLPYEWVVVFDEFNDFKCNLVPVGKIKVNKIFPAIQENFIFEISIKAEKNRGFVAEFSTSSQLFNLDLWYADLRASMHVTNRCDWMNNMKSPPISIIIVATKAALSMEYI